MQIEMTIKGLMVDPITNMARHGRLEINRARREVKLVLTNSVKYQSLKPEEADVSRIPGDLILSLNPDAVFPQVTLQRGPNEKTIGELRADIKTKVANHISPHPEIIALQQKFSIPVTCLVFALIGLALGLTVAREGKLAGFVVGIAVIFAYYILMQLAESVTKGYYADPAAVAAGGHYLAAHMSPEITRLTIFSVMSSRRVSLATVELCWVETTTVSIRTGRPLSYSTVTWDLPSGRR